MFLDVTLKPREVKKDPVPVEKPRYDWVYENNINSGKEPLNLESIEHKYSQWRTNSSLSNFYDTLFYANQMNIRPTISDKMHYHYLYHSVKKIKRYGKKKTDEDKKLEKEIEKEQELISLISDFYKYNNKRAREALAILSEDQIQMIRDNNKGG